MAKMKVRISGTVVDVPVCWSEDQVAAAEACYPDGVVDTEAFADSGAGSGTALERRQIRILAKEALLKRTR